MQKVQSTALQHAAPPARPSLCPQHPQPALPPAPGLGEGMSQGTFHTRCTFAGTTLIHTFLCPSPVQTGSLHSGLSILTGFPAYTHCSKSKTWIRGCLGMPSKEVGDREQRGKQTNRSNCFKTSLQTSQCHFSSTRIVHLLSSCSFHLWWYRNELCPNNVGVSCTTCIHCCWFCLPCDHHLCCDFSKCT